MSVCSLERQEEIIGTVDYYFIDNSESFTNISDLNEYLANELGIENFDIRSVYNDFTDENKDLLNDLFLDYIGKPSSDFISEGGISSIIPKSTIKSNFNSIEVIDLFHTLPIAKAYFEGEMNSKIISNVLIGGKDLDHYVSSDSELTNNLNKLKYDLYRKIFWRKRIKKTL